MKKLTKIVFRFLQMVVVMLLKWINPVKVRCKLKHGLWRIVLWLIIIELSLPQFR